MSEDLVLSEEEWDAARRRVVDDMTAYFRPWENALNRKQSLGWQAYRIMSPSRKRYNAHHLPGYSDVRFRLRTRRLVGAAGPLYPRMR